MDKREYCSTMVFVGAVVVGVCFAAAAVGREAGVAAGVAAGVFCVAVIVALAFRWAFDGDDCSDNETDKINNRG